MIARAFVALIATAALAAPAAAQNEPSTAPSTHRPGGPEGMAGRFHEHEARRLKALHDVLEIRPDQEPAFQAFAAALQAQPSEREPEAAPPEQDMSALTTPERLDRVAKQMREREARRRARFERFSGAVKTLYVALSPEQKRAFDALPDLMGLAGHMGGGPMTAGGMDRHFGDHRMGPPSPPGA
ncbi:MAG: Spy/CpxP family protein refolding chaperone [Caulobacteraceae bacterium]|nr:Spy/CpxP family protein refolding chaperone [Caulobacteraceae bacterium]